MRLDSTKQQYGLWDFIRNLYLGLTTILLCKPIATCYSGYGKQMCSSCFTGSGRQNTRDLLHPTTEFGVIILTRH